MCMFGGSRVTLQKLKVAGTNLYARAHGDAQYLVYSMNVSAPEPVAMVLPLPVPPRSGEGAVRFIDLSGYPKFFVDVNEAFPPLYAPAAKSRGSRSSGPLKTTLRVHEAGDFVASFVPSLDDFDRLDARFRLDAEVWDALPRYADWGFAVFQLKDLAAPSGWRRIFGLKPKTIHPMAMEFPRRDPSRLFFPTVHVHDGVVHEQGDFDHNLFWQSDTRDGFFGLVSDVASTTVDVARTQGMVDGAQPFHREMLFGRRANVDHWLVEGAVRAE
ncbi:MAG: hypothetical protein KC657_35140 [Myxococcales bacterium]|nr:hypothetical protein [Myxococcales bacterium]